MIVYTEVRLCLQKSGCKYQIVIVFIEFWLYNWKSHYIHRSLVESTEV